MNKKIFLRKISSFLSLPKEILFDLPIISVNGNEEIMIQNYKNLLEYDKDLIRLNTKLGILRIEGRNFIIKKMSPESIYIIGLLKRFEYIN